MSNFRLVVSQNRVEQIDISQAQQNQSFDEDSEPICEMQS